MDSEKCAVKKGFQVGLDAAKRLQFGRMQLRYWKKESGGWPAVLICGLQSYGYASLAPSVGL